MKIRHYLLMLSLLMGLSSCDKVASFFKESEEAPAQPQHEVMNTEVEPVRELPRSKAFYVGLLEEFFTAHYGDCFKGCSYKEGSLSIIKLTFAGEVESGDSTIMETVAAGSQGPKAPTSVDIVGTHAYKREGGFDLSGQKFKVVLSLVDEGYAVDTYRESTQVLTSKSFWEKSTERLIIED